MSVKVALVGAVVITEGTSERLLFLMDTRDVVLHSYPLSKALLDQIQIQIININEWQDSRLIFALSF